MGDLDEVLVVRGLNQLGVADFENRCSSIAMKIFDNPEAPQMLTDEEMETLQRMLRSGTHGTASTRMDNLIEKNRVGGKFGYVLSRIFPSAAALAPRYPVVVEKRWLLPFVWIHRIAVTVFMRPMSVMREFTMLLRKKTQK